MIEVVNEVTEYVVKNFRRSINRDGVKCWYYEIHKVTKGQNLAPIICWHIGTEEEARTSADQAINNSIYGSRNSIVKRKSWLEKRRAEIERAKMKA